MEQPTYVLCVFSKLDRGGAESMCMNLFRRMDRDKVRFDFVKHTNEIGAFEEEIYTLGAKIYEAPTYKLFNHVRYIRWWKTHLKNHPEYRILHGHYFTIAPIYFRVGKAFDCTTIAHSHATIDKKSIQLITIIKLLILKFIERYSDYRFACSSEAGQWLFPRKGFELFPNAIDVEQYRFDLGIRAAVREELGLQDQLVLGTVGSIKTVKNPFGLIGIFAAVKQRMPDARLLWVGEGELRPAVQEKLKEHGLLSSVIFTGVRSDVNRLLQAMDVFLLPSFSEGLPVVTVEAQSAGLPCLISDVVSREAAITDLCTFLPHSQPELWADAVQKLNLVRRDMGEEIMKSGYDIRTTAKWLERFYVNL